MKKRDIFQAKWYFIDKIPELLVKNAPNDDQQEEDENVDEEEQGEAFEYIINSVCFLYPCTPSILCSVLFSIGFLLF